MNSKLTIQLSSSVSEPPTQTVKKLPREVISHTWQREENREESWAADDPNMPEWLKQYIEHLPDEPSFYSFHNGQCF